MFLFFNLLVIWSIWGQADCTSKGFLCLSLFCFLQVEFSGFQLKAAQRPRRSASRELWHIMNLRLLTAAIILCAICEPGAQISPNCLTDQSIWQPDLVMTRQQLPSISSLKNPQTFAGHRNYGLKPILAFKLFHFSHTTSNSSQKHPFPHHLSPLLSFCLIPFLVTSGLQRSKKRDSLSQIIYILSSLLIFLNISTLRNIVTNELYHKIPNDLHVFICFPQQTALG